MNLVVLHDSKPSGVSREIGADCCFQIPQNRNKWRLEGLIECPERRPDPGCLHLFQAWMACDGPDVTINFILNCSVLLKKHPVRAGCSVEAPRPKRGPARGDQLLEGQVPKCLQHVTSCISHLYISFTMFHPHHHISRKRMSMTGWHIKKCFSSGRGGFDFFPPLSLD